jgi:DNA-binding transcriptional ArsR family regulator
LLDSKIGNRREKTWLELIDEHPLRHDIWMVLDLYQELNVTEITQYVKRSKSTVSRVLIGMEDDELLISRRGKKEKGEKIPPKFFQINPKLKTIEDKWDEQSLLDDPKKLQEFYNAKIDEHKKVIKDLEKQFEYVKIMLDYFRDQVEDLKTIEQAKSIYKEFLSNINEPSCSIMHIDAPEVTY